MTTQVLLKLDKNLKELALQEARRDGVELQTIFISAIRDYLANRHRAKTTDENNPLGVEEVDEGFDVDGYETLADFREEGGVPVETLIKALKDKINE